MKDRIIIENTLYSLLLYFIYDKEWQSRDYILVGDRFPIHIKEKLKLKVNNISYFDVAWIRLNSKVLKDKVTLNIIRKKLNEYRYIYGNMDLQVVKKGIFVKKKYYLDDGSLTKLILESKDVRFSSLKGNIQKILYATLFEKSSLELKKMDLILPTTYKSLNLDSLNVEYIDIKNKWLDMSCEEKNNILSIFNVNNKDFESLTNRILLITQPLSEDLLCDENFKISTYKKLLKKYSLDETNIVIKPHPAERTDYSRFFTDATIIPSGFPIELLSLFGVNFSVAITLYSSSIEHIQANNVIFDGTPNINSIKIKINGFSYEK